MQRRFRLYPELRRHQDREPDEEERMLRERLPGTDEWDEGFRIMAHFGILLRDWHDMEPHERGEYRAWWREHGLRESLAHKVHKEVGEILAKRKDKNPGKGPSFLQRMMGRT